MVERASVPRCVIRTSSKTRPSFAALDISLDYLKATGLAKIGDKHAASGRERRARRVAGRDASQGTAG